jgi:D-alanine-D-alanine ligase
MVTPGIKNFGAWLKKRTIGVLLGGQSAERAISLKTGRAIYQSLKHQGFSVVAIDAGADLPRQLKHSRINLAYIALHGPGGEDGVVQGLLEWMKIPYTGSGVLASAQAMDKAASKKLFEAAGLATAKWVTIKNRSPDVGRPPLQFPLVVKPASQGSAVGITVVKNAKQWPQALRTAFRYDTTALVETFLDGPEITVGVLGSQTLPIIEILPQHGRPFYDFHAKYAAGGSRHIFPARISEAQAVESARLSLAACAALGTRGAARVDLIIDKKSGPTLLEVNTIPGMTPTSLLPDAAAAAGISFDALVVRIIEASLGA